MLKNNKGISLIILVLIIGSLVAISVGAIVLINGEDNSLNKENIINNVINTNKEEKPSNNIDVSGKITEAMVRNYKTAPASDFEYEEVEGGIKITNYIGNDLIVVIPDIIEGKQVVEIRPYIFVNDFKVKGVKFPVTVKELKNTFTNNFNIQVVICEGVESLLDASMLYCSQLHTIVLGDNLKKMGISCINGCKNLETVYISSSLIEISEDYALTVLYGCPKLTVQGDAGSYIESFCAEYNIPFEAK